MFVQACSQTHNCHTHLTLSHTLLSHTPYSLTHTLLSHTHHTHTHLTLSHTPYSLTHAHTHTHTQHTTPHIILVDVHHHKLAIHPLVARVQLDAWVVLEEELDQVVHPARGGKERPDSTRRPSHTEGSDYILAYNHSPLHSRHHYTPGGSKGESLGHKSLAGNPTQTF